MKKIQFIAVMICFSLTSYAQSDTAFWFAAPDVSSHGNFDRPIHLRIAAYQQPCNVTISQPAGGGLPTQVISIPANTMQSVNLTAWINSIECGPGNLIQNKGIKISSDNIIAVYYEVNANGPNPELFALKGKNSLGNEFYISSQYALSNSLVHTPRPISSFNIVATDDNTTVAITPTNAIVGHAANVPFSIVLNRGQTYAAIATSAAAAQHLHGSYVTSSKPVAITLADDLLEGGPVYGGVCQDLAGDQTIPINILGNEYIAVRSNLSAPYDKLYITATQNTTAITQDGVFVMNLNAGQSTELSMPGNTSYIQSSAPVYAYQLSGIGCEVGSTLLPKITCTGSSAVSVARSTNESLILTLLIKNGGQSGFLVNNVPAVINAGQFNVVPNTGGLWYYAKVNLPLANYPNGSVVRVTNTLDIFQLGVFQGGVLSGTAVGYFSDYNTLTAEASTTTQTLCIDSTIRLFANFIASATYSWTGPNEFTSSLQNPVISNATTLHSGTYNLTITVPGCGTYSDAVSVTVNTCSATIINDYTPVMGLNICTNVLHVEDGTAFIVGDTVLLIQMKGAVVDSTNTSAFGAIIDYKNAGNYEYNYVKSKTGNAIELSNTLTRQYDIPNGKVQLIRVPYYTDLTTTDILTCLPWDGNKGGILAFNVQNTLTLNKDVTVSGRGFRGGVNTNTAQNTLACNQADYFYNTTATQSGKKGEGIALIGSTKLNGKGKAGNGGGGGNGHNSGGGGGSNASAGGLGGYQLDNCGSAPFDNRGIGGSALTYSNAINKIFLGGGGGAAHYDGAFGSGFYSNGGNGGGIILINANSLVSNNHTFTAKGTTGEDCLLAGFPCNHDGMAGGGAGGTIILGINTFVDNNVQNVSGGKGANLEVYNAAAGKVGPGGGGSGGVVWFKTAGLPANTTVQNTGGANGVIVPASNDPWGATSGSAGVNLFNLVVPVSTVPFQKNIDSVRIKDSILSCNDFDFKGLAYINSSPVASWQWYFGDGGQATTQNTTHAYATAGLYTVKLIVTDINGCMDSVLTNVNALPAVTADAGSDVSICTNGSASVMLNGTAVGGPYSWSPAIYLDNPSIANPTATISSTTTFYLNVTGSPTCNAIDSVVITINPVPLVDTRTDTAICRNYPLVLHTSSNATAFQWSPAANVSDPNIASPDYTGNTSGWLYVTASFASGCSATDSLYVTVNPAPVVDARTDTAICIASPLVLTTNSDATTFQWTPAASVSNPAIASPDYISTTSGWVYVTGYFASGCSATDSLYVTVNPVPFVTTRPDTAICRSYPLVLSTGSNATNFQWSPAANVSNPNIANPNFTGSSSGWMYVTASFASGCAATDSLYVTVNPTPFVDTRPDTAICRGATLTLTTSSDATFIQWTPVTAVSTPNFPSPQYISTTSGWVYVTGYFASGCAATDSLYVTVNPVPLVNTRVDTSICRSSPLVLTTSSNAASYQWSPAGAVSNPGIASPNYIDNVSQWVYVTGTTLGCSATDSLYVTVNPLPVVQTIADTTLCQDITITLTTTGAQAYSWSPTVGLSNPAIASPVFTGNTGQTYTVTGTDVNGCRNTDMVIINVSTPIVFKQPPAFTMCEQRAVRLDGNNGNQATYLWSPATYLSNATIINPVANPPQTTLYSVLVTDKQCGTDSIFTTLLTVVPAPVINARKSNDIDCAFRSATLFAGGGNQYIWSPATGLSNPNIANPVAIPAGTQTYTVLVTDATGCTNTDSVTVVNKRAASLARYMPNAFTPDGNGINDCYGLKNWMYIQQLQFYIFNRYGEQVFGTANPNACWDGTYKGKPALAGTYVYVIKAKTDCGLEEQKGTFILIR